MIFHFDFFKCCRFHILCSLVVVFIQSLLITSRFDFLQFHFFLTMLQLLLAIGTSVIYIIINFTCQFFVKSGDVEKGPFQFVPYNTSLIVYSIMYVIYWIDISLSKLNRNEQKKLLIYLNQCNSYENIIYYIVVPLSFQNQ